MPSAGRGGEGGRISVNPSRVGDQLQRSTELSNKQHRGHTRGSGRMFSSRGALGPVLRGKRGKPLDAPQHLGGPQKNGRPRGQLWPGGSVVSVRAGADHQGMNEQQGRKRPTRLRGGNRGSALDKAAAEPCIRGVFCVKEEQGGGACSCWGGVLHRSPPPGSMRNSTHQKGL